MRDQEHITPIDQYVIDFIRELRIKKDISQKQLADILGVTKSYVSSIESNNSRAKYNLKYINIIADYYDMSPKDFMPKDAQPLEFMQRQLLSKSKHKKG